MSTKRITFSEIMSSKGMEYINRAHFRTHTLNIFIRSAESLLSALKSLTDPSIHIGNLNPNSAEESAQILRDIVWLLHNFLASSKTLVDHTRVFVEEYYLGTEVNKKYKEHVNRNFANNPLTKFVHDLRNYMVHRGPPPINRILSGRQLEGGQLGEVKITTGFYLLKTELMIWKGWTSESKKFLDISEERIDILPIVEEYTSSIYKFHDELDDLIREHHKDDLAVLSEMEKAFDEQRNKQR